MVSCLCAVIASALCVSLPPFAFLWDYPPLLTVTQMSSWPTKHPHLQEGRRRSAVAPLCGSLLAVRPPGAGLYSPNNLMCVPPAPPRLHMIREWLQETKQGR